MKIQKVEEYLAGHRAEAIKMGRSGADVYEIDGRYILKHVRREKLGQEGLFDSYLREACFYQSSSGQNRGYLPEILEVEIAEDEAWMLMKRYSGIERSAVSGDLLQRIMRTLAKVHTDEIPDFLRRDKKPAEPLSDKEIAECLAGWQTVLAEHEGAFDESGLNRLAKGINDLILWHDTEERVLCHGDFHWDNLLMTESGDIVICDWQGVGEGSASGDLSFFLSRLRADGVGIDENQVLDCYTEAIRELSGKKLRKEEISKHMSAANAITSFLFWHQYLHGSTEERVQEIYGRMTG